ncbi:HNH endonuclease [Rhizobium laguerreae]|uniref:HNH endonuclease signature motif containing protein n=1 Tax=Rhizobium laguerreae TaxID=1076926 RepID=UPI001C917A83|nr:HNH endonuclease [Rhizobium laguerreae]MBY3333758.1 HNH endonuclease [Rhizobium laguerreae]
MAKPDRRSEEAALYRRMYKTARWQRLREHQLSIQPLCEFCLVTEEVTAADVVDHRKAHKGQLDLFYDPSNLQSLCKYHHDGAKQMIDNGKKVVTYGVDGYPIEL